MIAGPPRTIAGRVLLASISSVVVVVTALAVAAPLIAESYATDTLTERLRGDAAIVADLSRDALRRRDAAELDRLANAIAAATGVRITVVAADGEVLGESGEDRTRMENHAGRPEIAAVLGGGTVGRSVRRSTTVDAELLYVAVPVIDGGRRIGAARAAFPVDRLETLASRLAGGIALAGLLGGAAALAVAVLLGRATTGPLRVLAAAIRSGAPPVAPPGATDEVRDLAEALRRAAEAAVAERRATAAERDRLATLVRELGDAVLIVGGDDVVEMANPAAERILGARPLAGRRAAEVIRDHETLDVLARARAGDEISGELERQDPPRTLRVVARRLAGGERLLVIQDLTRLRRLETVRRDFVANVSHELRTPIASIKAMVEALESGALRQPEAALDFVARIHTEVEDLAQLVNELLDLSRAESGTAALELEDVTPAELVLGPIERLAPLASRSGVSIDVADLAGLAPVRADRQKVAQVVMSLLHNAIKFTPRGGRVSVRAQAAGGAIRFELRDTGIGLRREEVDRVFERFYKGERSRSGSGTGLGLAIAKHVVLAHGGAVSADSEGPGRGSTFAFTLPVAKTP